MQAVNDRGHGGHQSGVSAVSCPLFPTADKLQVLQSSTKFGSEAREALFALRPGVAYLNHGSYGAALRLSSEVAAWYRLRQEEQNVMFMEGVALKGLVQAVSAVASLVQASPLDVVPVTNATTAVNCVLQSLTLRPGDLILLTNLTYPAVRSAAVRAAAAAGAGILELQLGLAQMLQPDLVLDVLDAALRSVSEAGDQDSLWEGAVNRVWSMSVGPRPGWSVVFGLLTRLVSAVWAEGRRVLERWTWTWRGRSGGRPGSRVRLAIFDHVVSFPPVVMPIAGLAWRCRQDCIPVLVDGAHAACSLPHLDIPALGVHYYTSNLHKWACCPKGTAFLWVHPRAQQGLLLLVTSHGYGLGFRGEFLWQGTQDVAGWLAVPAALTVLGALGLERVAQHNNSLVQEGAEMLLQAWHKTKLSAAATLRTRTYAQAATGGAATPSYHTAAGAAAAARASSAAAPSQIATPDEKDETTEVTGAGELPLLLGGDGKGGLAAMLVVRLPHLSGVDPTPAAAAALHDWLQGCCSIEVPVVCYTSTLWVRISAQIYNTRAEYLRLAEAVLAYPAALKTLVNQ
ncbi:MAG: hypothetical protein WDW36_002075 [Sanguina aurantia]